MKKSYKTAQGQLVDIDALRLANEEAIAVGNMRVNARGDELGPGGVVAKGRNQVMDEYYQIKADPVETMLKQQTQGVDTQETLSVVPEQRVTAPIDLDETFQAAAADVRKSAKPKKSAGKKEKPAETQVAVIAETVVATEPAVNQVVAAVDEPTEVESNAVGDGVTSKPLRGSLADSVAKDAQVNQTLLTPLNKRNGIQRI